VEHEVLQKVGLNIAIGFIRKVVHLAHIRTHILASIKAYNKHEL